jgi:hypothetical protein
MAVVYVVIFLELADDPQNKGLWPLRYQSYKQFGI